MNRLLFLIGVGLTALAVVTMIQDGPSVLLVIGALGGLGVAALSFPVTTTKVEPTTVLPPADPGLRDEAIAKARQMPTEALVARHNVGARYGGVLPEVMAAVEVVLEERGVPLCSCGAPLPDGVHEAVCQEVRS
ncbi:hypothetical protein ACWEQG_01510 [Microbispora sp. NPDC004025]